MLLDNPFVSDQRVEKEAKCLVDRGVEVTVICKVGKGLPENEVRNGITIHRWMTPLTNKPQKIGYKAHQNFLSQKILELNPHTLHCHDIFMLLLGSKIKAQKPDIHLIYDSHEYLRGWLYYQEIPRVINRLKGRLVWQYLIQRERNICRNQVAKIITTSTAIAQKIQSNYTLKYRPLVLRNISTITSETSIKSNLLRQTLGIPDDEKIMIQSGNIYQSKDLLDAMFQAVVDTPALHFVMINNRPIGKEIQAWVDSTSHWQERIHIVDYDQNKLAEMIQSADFGLLYMNTKNWSSHYLTSPNRIYEYSTCQLPIISVPQFCSEELAKKFGHVIFFDPGEPKSFRHATRTMLNELTDLIEKAKSYDLDWNKEIQSVLAYYDSINYD
ncbi:MAG: glycosyltransferase [Salibacteraceae bacterium]